jgi:N-acetylglucosamine malate deacetylase 1
MNSAKQSITELGSKQESGLANVNNIDTVAVIAAHPDDEVLGCGGAIARFVDTGRQVHVLLLSEGVTSRSAIPDAVTEADLQRRNCAAARANEILRSTSLEQHQFPDNRMDAVARLDIVKIVEEFVLRVRPGLVLTHHAGDVNIDHRVVHDAVVAACRPQPGFAVRELMFFEIASSTEWRPAHSGMPFWPNVFVDITGTVERKLEALRAYSEELREFPHPRSLEAIEALARWRGATAGVRAAEAFLLGRSLI